MKVTEEHDYFGRGWSYPPVFDANQSEVLMTEGVEDINNSLKIILTTKLGERIMLPKFGCAMDDFVFETLDSATLTFIQDMIRTAIIYHEARIDLEDVLLDLDNGSGTLNINIFYKLRNANSRFNFVFPFYLNEANNPI